MRSTQQQHQSRSTLESIISNGEDQINIASDVRGEKSLSGSGGTWYKNVVADWNPGHHRQQDWLQGWLADVMNPTSNGEIDSL